MRERTTTGVFVLLLACSVGLVLLISGEGTTTAAQAAPGAQAPLQVQETDTPGVVAEVTECRRKEGVLTVKVRFRNTSDQTAEFQVILGKVYDEHYITADSKKYFILRDSEGTYLAPYTSWNLIPKLEKGQSYLWWAKYPAPPPEVKKINIMIPRVQPFEDVPITDR